MIDESEKLSRQDFDDIPDVKNMDRFVKVTEAARILGFSSFVSIYQMVERGELNAYSLPNHSRKRILLSELLEFASTRKATITHSFPIRVYNDGAPDRVDSEDVKRNRGRPRKYEM